MPTKIELPNSAYILPEQIPMWPPAWWFWLVLAALITGMAVLLIFWVKRTKQRRYRKEAISLLRLVDVHHSSYQIAKACIEAIRRTLLTEQRDTLASLPIDALFEQLDTLKGHQKYPLKRIQQPLEESLYKPNSQLAPQQHELILLTTSHWLRKHHV